MTSSPAARRRADARRSRAAILDAAVRILDERPDASLGAIAEAAGVTRQTVYAHFSSRERLLAGVVERITEEVAAAMDAAAPDEGPAAGALLRVLDAAERAARRSPALTRRISELPAGAEADRDRHLPVTDRIARVVERGRRGGEFDDSLPLDWLVSVIVRLAHAAGEERAAGRMADRDAAHALHVSVLRVLGAAGAAEGRPSAR
ncbi:transcriptional regulator, TetR family [Actinomadura meyerae]|jgi:AcrR family transcriptional regulator|uniref:Transcriptional regulator, TetR family n=1 Tax=Actinomadura meyerae TaxID=240840 RepID=A0A239IWB5_9ACTN|nr:TetR/AcrR family transcriptional regulator [Actinomadura meyerae]SNS97303.1 transcriptional regulator, TetR family [Actinomadura meyerae]